MISRSNYRPKKKKHYYSQFLENAESEDFLHVQPFFSNESATADVCFCEPTGKNLLCFLREMSLKVSGNVYRHRETFLSFRIFRFLEWRAKRTSFHIMHFQKRVSFPKYTWIDENRLVVTEWFENEKRDKALFMPVTGLFGLSRFCCIEHIHWPSNECSYRS